MAQGAIQFDAIGLVALFLLLFLLPSTLHVTAAFSAANNNNKNSIYKQKKTAGIISMSPCPQLLHRFFILRHGETDANASGVIQGSTDVSRLTERGKAQAASVAAQVFGEANPHIQLPIDAIYVSPLTRARETLTILRQFADSGMLPPTETTLQDLREIDLYSWEGRNVKDIQLTDADSYQAWKEGDTESIVVDDKLPIKETWKRAETVWDTIRKQELKQATVESAKDNAKDSMTKERSTLLVCHGTLGQALLCSAFGLDETHFRWYEFPNCGLVEIFWNSHEDFATSWKWHHPEPSERLHPPVDTTLA